MLDEGAVGVRLDGVEMLPCVSQGAAPIGPELTITAAEGHVIGELAGKPALEKLRETIEGLPAEDLALVQGGLLMGIVVDANKPDYVQGDFLVRGLVGADPGDRPGRGRPPTSTPARSCGCTRATPRAPTATCARRWAIRMAALGGRAPAGALVFSCNGRGRGLFGRADHDAEAVADDARPARRPRGSSRPARSARSAASTSCTASRRPSRCSPDPCHSSPP